ncbi:MAG: hypothetical protein WDW36_009078 [Sanguina aurantia]
MTGRASAIDLSQPTSILQALTVLAAIVTVHECGHFFAARLQGIHVSKFSIGFGPSLFTYQGKVVEYSLRAIPLGGYVAFPDDDPSTAYAPDDPDLLKNRSIGERAVVISAGVVANFIFAYVVLFVQIATLGRAVPTFAPGVRIPEVLSSSSAARAGFKSRDIILKATVSPHCLTPLPHLAAPPHCPTSLSLLAAPPHCLSSLPHPTVSPHCRTSPFRLAAPPHCLSSLPHLTAPPRCPASLSHHTAPPRRFALLSHLAAPPHCPTSLPHLAAARCPTSLSHLAAAPHCPTSLPRLTVAHHCLTPLPHLAAQLRRFASPFRPTAAPRRFASPSHLAAPPHCRTSLPHLTAPPHCLSSLPHPTVSPHCLTPLSHLTAPPRCPTSLPHLIAPPRRPTSLPHLAVSPHCPTSPFRLAVAPHCPTSPPHLAVSPHRLTSLPHLAVAPRRRSQIGDYTIPSNAEQVSSVVAQIQAAPGVKIDVLVQRGDTQVVLPVVPDIGDDGRGRIGVQLVSNVAIRHVPASGVQEIAKIAGLEWQRLANTVTAGLTTIFTNFSKVSSQLSGPVAIVVAGSEIARSDSAGLFQFCAIVNINLGVVNLLPLPALDGGYLMLLMIEGLRGKKLPEKLEQTVMASGFLLLAGVGITLVIRDTLNLIPQ